MLRATAGVAALLALAGCAGSDRDPGSTRAGEGDGAGRFPAASLEDWRSYADHVVEYSVVGESMRPVATLRIDRILWSAPEAPSLPNEITMRAPQLEVGERFVAPLAQVEKPFVEWWPLNTNAALPVVDGRVTTSPELNSPVGKKFAGRTVAELNDALAEQAPDPLAAKHADLRPTERVQAVLAEGGFADG